MTTEITLFDYNEIEATQSNMLKECAIQVKAHSNNAAPPLILTPPVNSASQEQKHK